jgi:hypothetical protein
MIKIHLLIAIFLCAVFFLLFMSIRPPPAHAQTVCAGKYAQKADFDRCMRDWVDPQPVNKCQDVADRAHLGAPARPGDEACFERAKPAKWDVACVEETGQDGEVLETPEQHAAYDRCVERKRVAAKPRSKIEEQCALEYWGHEINEEGYRRQQAEYERCIKERRAAEYAWWTDCRHGWITKQFEANEDDPPFELFDTSIRISYDELRKLLKDLPRITRALKACDAYRTCLRDRDAGKVKHCYSNDRRWREFFANDW